MTFSNPIFYIKNLSELLKLRKEIFCFPRLYIAFENIIPRGRTPVLVSCFMEVRTILILDFFPFA